jgi:hypothetical protein
MGSKPPLDIKVGNREGLYFSQGLWDRLQDVANELAGKVEGITDWEMWYDASEDFHHLAFRLDGSRYDIRLYKVFCVTKDGARDFLKEKNFARRDWELVDFFAFGRYRDWSVA